MKKLSLLTTLLLLSNSSFAVVSDNNKITKTYKNINTEQNLEIKGTNVRIVPENSVCKDDVNGKFKCVTLKEKESSSSLKEDKEGSSNNASKSENTVATENSVKHIYKYKELDGSIHYSDELPQDKKIKAIILQ